MKGQTLVFLFVWIRFFRSRVEGCGVGTWALLTTTGNKSCFRWQQLKKKKIQFFCYLRQLFEFSFSQRPSQRSSVTRVALNCYIIQANQASYATHTTHTANKQTVQLKYHHHNQCRHKSPLQGFNAPWHNRTKGNNTKQIFSQDRCNKVCGGWFSNICKRLLSNSVVTHSLPDRQPQTACQMFW